MQEVILIRQGQTEAEECGVIDTASPMSPKGARQAISAKDDFGMLDIDEIYAADTECAIRSAEPLSGEYVSYKRRCREFTELWFGDAEGKSAQNESPEMYNNFAAYMRDNHAEDPHVRSLSAQTRIRELLKEISENPDKYPHQRIAIVLPKMMLKCVVMREKYGENWKSLLDMPHTRPLDGIKLMYKQGQVKDISYFIHS